MFVMLAIATSIVGGSLVWAKSVEFLTESASAVVFRTKPTMSLQPRPFTAPLRNFELVPFQQFDPPARAGVVLLGIEDFDKTEGPAAALLPMGQWTPRR